MSMAAVSMAYWARRFAGVAILLLIWGAVSGAQGDSLTLAEAQRLASAQSQKIVASRYTRDAASQVTHSAGALPDPVLKFGVENVPVSGPDAFTLGNDFMTMTRVGLMQEFTRSGKRNLLNERATQSIAMADAEAANSIANVQRDTALAWFSAYYAERAAQIVKEQVTVVEAEAQAVESAYGQGRGNSADVLAARGMLALTQDQASAATSRVRSARIALARFIGDDAQRPLLTRPNVDVLPSHVHESAQFDEQLRMHPDLQLLERQEEIAATDAKLARAERLTKWSVEVSYAWRGPMYDDMISLEVAVPLQINRHDRQDPEIASRLSLAAAAKAQREDAYREHVAEVRAMRDEWTTVKSRHDNYQQNILPLARDRSAAAAAAYRGGKAMLEQVIAARRNEIDVSLQALQLDAEIARLWASLSFLTTITSDASVAGGTGTQP
jgi:outer membrane protein TolC